MADIKQHSFPSGLQLLAEPMTGVQSAAFTFLTPAGNACQPHDQLGVAPLLAEVIGRGAGGLTSRQHSDALDDLGVHRSISNGNRHLRIGAVLVGDQLHDTLPLLLDQALAPNLDPKELEPARDLCLQEIDALDDEPQSKVMIDLRSRHFPEPLGRPSVGKREHLEQITLDQLRAFWQDTVRPGGSILAVAGNIDFDALVQRVGELTVDWAGSRDEIQTTAQPTRGTHHQDDDTEQVHIALAYDALPDPDERSILQRMGNAVLSAGTASRLFSEVREKRGLCYSVYASYAGMKDRGAILGYAGTTTPRAQETLDVMLAEIHKLTDGITADELERARVGMKSRLVIQGESTSARASAIAADLYVRGKARTLSELADQVDAVTLDAVNDFLKDNPPGDMTLATIGRTALTIN
ncbi:MAG: M16 family metallopeptidase [Phycisphaerales bacterium JB063]